MPAARSGLRPPCRERRSELLAQGSSGQLCSVAHSELPEDPADARQFELPFASHSAGSPPARCGGDRGARGRSGCPSTRLLRRPSAQSPRRTGDAGPAAPCLAGGPSAFAPPAAVHGLKLPSFDSNFNPEPGPQRGPRKIWNMHARKLLVSSFALALALGLVGVVGASPDAPAAAPATSDAPKAHGMACCKHHDAADKTGMNCDHAKMKAEGEKGKACCAQHAAMHKEGAPADAQASCAKHAEMMKGDAGTGAKACCAQHAEMKKDGTKGDCCCGDGEACPHHAAAAPAKS